MVKNIVSLCHPSLYWTSSIESYCFSRLGHLHMLCFQSSLKFLSWQEKLDTCLAEWQLSYKSWCSSSYSKPDCVLAFINRCIWNKCRPSWDGVVRPPLVSLPSLPPLFSDLTAGESERDAHSEEQLQAYSTLCACPSQSLQRNVCMCARTSVCVWAWQQRDPSTEDVLRLWGSVYRRSDCRLMWLTCLLACVLTQKTSTSKRVCLIYLLLRYNSTPFYTVRWQVLYHK